MSSSQPSSAKKPLTFKKGPNGKYQISLSDLKQIQVAVPPSFKLGNNLIVFGQDPAGNTFTGLTDKSIPLKSIDNVTNLWNIPRLTKSFEDEAARVSKNQIAQRMLYDVYHAAGVDSRPSPEFERAAIDVYATKGILEENVRVLTQSKDPTKELDELARSFLLGEAERINAGCRGWLTALARGDAAPKSLTAALKAVNISSWSIAKLLTMRIPSTTTSWIGFLFPKDMGKGIRLTMAEFNALKVANEVGAILFIESRKVFDCVDLLGKTDNKKKSDKELTYPLVSVLPIKSMAQGRPKPVAIKTIDPILGPIVSTLLNMRRAILPFGDKPRDKMLALLFSDPKYLDSVTESPLSQIVTREGQKLYPIKWGMIVQGISLYNYGAQIVEAVMYQDPPKGFDDLPEEYLEEKSDIKLPKKINLSNLAPIVMSNDPKFVTFQGLLKTLGLMQPKSKDKIEKVYPSFVSTPDTNLLTTLLRERKHLYPALPSVMKFLNSFDSDEFRNVAARQLFATFEAIEKPQIYSVFEHDESQMPTEEYLGEIKGQDPDEDTGFDQDDE